jgi:hypothetical protein
MSGLHRRGGRTDGWCYCALCAPCLLGYRLNLYETTVGSSLISLVLFGCPFWRCNPSKEPSSSRKKGSGLTPNRNLGIQQWLPPFKLWPISYFIGQACHFLAFSSLQSLQNAMITTGRTSNCHSHRKVLLQLAQRYAYSKS